MGISVGSSYLTADISNDRIKEIFNTHAPPHMTIWEKIKDFFFCTGEREALDCLFKLCKPTPDLTSSDIEATFYRLKELCSPGYKERFCNNHINTSNTKKLHIKDESGGDFLYIEINGGVCKYNILGELLVFNDNTPPWSTQEHETNINGLSITHKEINPKRLLDNIEWARNNLNIAWLKKSSYCASYGSDHFQLDFEVFYKDVVNYITSVNKDNKFLLWREQEKETYISSSINKEIDTQVINKQIKVSKQDKDDIFNRSIKALDLCDLKLNSQFAQSSIKQVVLTLIRKNESFGDFIKKTANDTNSKNVITTDMVNALSNHIFEKMFMNRMKLPHDWNNVIRTSVSNSLNNKPARSV